MTDAYNAAERRHVREAAKSAKFADRQRADVVTSIMSVANGRAWVLEILEQCHAFASSFTGNALQTAFAEGERNVGLRLLNDIMACCPDRYVEMMRERQSRDLTAERRRSQNGDGGVERSDDPDFDGEGRWIGQGPDPRQPGQDEVPWDLQTR